MEEIKEKENTLTKLNNVSLTSNGFTPVNIDEAWRFSCFLAKSDIVPTEYKGKPENCLIAIDIASRLKMSWLTIMQHLYMIHGRPALDSTITVALINASNIYPDGLEYEVEGEDVRKANYRVRAYATRAVTGKIQYGPWITWELVKGEGWDSKAGSKWKSMPEQMFHYRAASWFQRRHCPEVTLGMPTSDEMFDTLEKKKIDSTIIDEAPKSKFEKFKERLADAKQEGVDNSKTQQEATQTVNSENAANIIQDDQKIEQALNNEESKPLESKPETPKGKSNKTKAQEQKEKLLKDAEATAKAKFGIETTIKYKCKNGHLFDKPIMNNVLQEYTCPECGDEYVEL